MILRIEVLKDRSETLRLGGIQCFSKRSDGLPHFGGMAAQEPWTVRRRDVQAFTQFPESADLRFGMPGKNLVIPPQAGIDGDVSVKHPGRFQERVDRQ